MRRCSHCPALFCAGICRRTINSHFIHPPNCANIFLIKIKYMGI